MAYDPNATSHLFLAPPSWQHLLGTTVVGEDIFSQLIYGTRTSVFWGLGTGLLLTILSVLVGLVAGYSSGWVDDVLTLLTNVSLVLPALPLAIVLAAYFPRGPLTISLVIVGTNWAWQARVLRAQTLSVRSREFVTAARASGESAWRITDTHTIRGGVIIETDRLAGDTTSSVLPEDCTGMGTFAAPYSCSPLPPSWAY